MFNQGKGWTVQPSRVICHESSFSYLSRMTGDALNLDNLMRLQRDCNDHSGTYIGTAPALSTAPELKANAKLVMRHQRGALARKRNKYSVKPSE
jgi:hypothetical protein